MVKCECDRCSNERATIARLEGRKRALIEAERARIWAKFGMDFERQLALVIAHAELCEDSGLDEHYSENCLLCVAAIAKEVRQWILAVIDGPPKGTTDTEQADSPEKGP